MNLVDAIRKTSSHHHAPAVTETITAEAHDAHAHHKEVSMSHSQHFVRIELFLSPDQIQHLLKDSIGAQLTIMTSHEVAQLLRTTTKNVEHLAEEGKLPGFLLENAWRFNRETIDEWLAAHSQHKAA